MKIQIKRAYKSIRVVQAIELPDFVVLTGKNGSGKSHFMEAMANPEICGVLDCNGKLLSQIKYIPFNGLNPNIDEKCEYLGLTNSRKEAWQSIRQQIADYERWKKLSGSMSFEQFVTQKKRRKTILGKLGVLVGWDPGMITEKLFADNYEISSEEIFSSKFASIFKLYHVRLVENKFNKYLNETEGQRNNVLFDEAFERLYGPKPWVLINNMLSRAGLPYRVNHPEGGGNKELDFTLNLTDVNTGTVIHVNDLPEFATLLTE